MKKNTISPFKILLRIPVPWVFVLTYLIGLLLNVVFPIRIHAQELFFVKVFGIVLFVIGTFIASWSLIIFHKAQTTTTPGESSKKLIMQGPYRFTRNPMYVSLTLAYLGEAGFLVQLWPVLVLPLILLYVNWVVIPLEEHILEMDFKEEYENYCNHVRRWI